MTVGNLGSVYFSVSADMVKTLTDLSMNKSINYGSHKVHGGKALLEFIGIEPDEISFSVEMSAFLGVNPTTMIDALDRMADAGQAVAFVLGTKIYGPGKWVITNLGKAFGQTYKDGALLTAKVKISLKEYAG